MKLSLRYAHAAPFSTEGVQTFTVEHKGCTYGFRLRADGLLVHAEMPIHHALIIVPMGMNSAVLFHKPEPR